MADDGLNNAKKGSGDNDDLDMGDDWASALSDEEGGSATAMANFENLGEGAVSGETHNLDFLMDIPQVVMTPELVGMDFSIKINAADPNSAAV